MWAKFDDHFDDDPDCDIVGEIGICLFLCSITWSSRNLTDGFIPLARVKKLPGGTDKASLAALLSVQWWTQVDGGYQIRSFLKFNQAKEEVLASRERQRQINERRSEAGQRGGQKSGEVRAARGEDQPEAEPKTSAEAQANIEANIVDIPSKNEANDKANNGFCLPETEAKAEPPVSRIPHSESRLPNPAAAAPPTSPSCSGNEDPPGDYGFSDAAAAVSLHFSRKQMPEQKQAPEQQGMPAPQPEAPKPRFSGQIRSGQNSSGMSALHSILPALPEANQSLLPNKPPLLVLSSEEADGRLLSHALRDCGVSRQEANLLVSEALRPGNPFSWNDIRDQIAWLPHQKATNPGHWLPIYIRQGRAKPKALAEAERAEKKRKNESIADEKRGGTPSLLLAEKKAQQDARNEALQVYQDGLTETERTTLLSEAEASFLEISIWRDCLLHQGRDSGAWRVNFKLHLNKIIDERLSV